MVSVSGVEVEEETDSGAEELNLTNDVVFDSDGDDLRQLLNNRPELTEDNAAEFAEELAQNPNNHIPQDVIEATVKRGLRELRAQNERNEPTINHRRTRSSRDSRSHTPHKKDGTSYSRREAGEDLNRAYDRQRVHRSIFSRVGPKSRDAKDDSTHNRQRDQQSVFSRVGKKSRDAKEATITAIMNYAAENAETPTSSDNDNEEPQNRGDTQDRSQ